MSTSMSAFHIAIIGGGPAGLMLARLLHILPRSVKYTIFESDSTPTSRSQGSTLDLHPLTGLAAVKKAGLWEEFQKHVRYDGEALKWVDKNCTIYHQEEPGVEGKSNGRPEIDRVRLREILLASIPSDAFRWGRRLQSVKREGLDKFTLVFKDGSEESGFDYVVGADGAWSHVRGSLVSDQMPFYSGISGLVAVIPDAKNRDPETYALVNRGSVFAYTDGRGLMAQYIGDGSIKLTSWIKKPKEEPPKMESLADVQGYLQKEFSDWSPRLTKCWGNILLDANEKPDIMVSDLFMLPTDWRWEHKKGVTLIGDAAHLMTPFAGEGVNLALTDGMQLADAIARAMSSTGNGENLHDAIDKEVALVEETMFPRTQKMREITYENLCDQFSDRSVGEWLPRLGARVLLATNPNFAFGSQALAEGLMRVALPMERGFRMAKQAIVDDS